MNDNDWETIRKITGLKSLDLSGAVATKVPENQFSEFTAFEEIKLSPSVKSIGSQSFYKTSLKTITFPADVESIGNYAFESCQQLASVSFEPGSKLTKIGESSFNSCVGLETVSLPDMLTTISSQAFYGCSKLSNLVLPAGLITIESSAFRNAKNLTFVDFPETLKTIRSEAFRETGLEVVVLPKGVSYIGSSAFYRCKSLTELVLPGEVLDYTKTSTNSGISSVFYECSALKSITCLATTPPVIDSATLYNVDLSQVTLHVPDFSIVNYKLADGWLECGTIVGDVKSDEWYVKGDLSLSNNRRMEGTPAVTLAGGSTLTVGGVDPMPMSSLKMRADFTKSVWSYPQFINGSAAMTAGDVSTEITVSANRWYFITIPYEVKVSEILHSDSNASIAVRHYDGGLRASAGSGGWQDEEEIMHEGQGYIVQTNQAGVITFPAYQNGTEGLFYPNAKKKQLESNTSDDPANSGWNLVGNPWQSHYDMYYTMLTSPIIIWNHSDRNYVAYSLIDDDVILPPYRNFFIQATDEVKEIEFGTAGRQFTVETMRNNTRSAAADRELYNLELIYNGVADRTRIVLNSDASLAYEPGRDAVKFLSDDSGVPQLYSVSESGDRLSINERPIENGEIKLGFYSPGAGELCLSLPKADGNVEITDSKTGETYVMAAGDSFLFTADENGNCDDRLSIKIIKPLSGIASPEAAPAEIICDGSVIKVIGEKSVNITIVSLDGIIEVNQTLTEGNGVYHLPAGLHIVKAGSMVKKCVIK